MEYYLPFHQVATAAAAAPLSSADLRESRTQLVEVSIAALAALLFATVLSVYKPRGLTPYGWRLKQKEISSLPSLR